MRYSALFLIVTACCFVLQAVALQRVGGRTTKSESNYFSSLGRIQAGATGKPEIMLLGSSITGRLPDRAQGFPGLANMGCDGGSAVDTLRAMDAGILPTAPVMVIEANTLPLALRENTSEIGKAMKSPWFAAGLRLPLLSAYARPSAFLYSKLLVARTGSFGTYDPATDLQVKSRPAPVSQNSGNFSPSEANLSAELIGIIKRLEKRGSRCVFVWLPPGRGGGGGISDWITHIIAESDAEWWDLGTECDPSLITLTDGVHMAAPSAARTATSLKKGVE